MGKQAKKVCFSDFETTGLDPSKHEIIELAAIVVDPNSWQILRELELKVRPEHIGTADSRALDINGYDPDTWADAVSLEWAMSELEPLLCDAIPAGHNPRFDFGFLEAAWKRVGHRPRDMDYHLLDTVALCMPLYLRGCIPDLKLKTVCSYLGVGDPTHRAMADCRASLEIAKMLIGRWPTTVCRRTGISSLGADLYRPESAPYGDPGAPDTIDGVPLNEPKSVTVKLLKGSLLMVENLEMICRYQLGDYWARFSDASGREVAFPAKDIINVAATPHRGEA